MALPHFVLPLALPFAFLVGDWVSQEETTGAGGKPEKFTLQGRNRLILTENALQMDETFSIGGEKMANHIVMTADPAGTIRAWWFSSQMPSRPLQFEGTREGQNMTLSSADKRYRIVYEILKEGRYNARLEAKSPNSEEYSVLTKAEYTRKSK